MTEDNEMKESLEGIKSVIDVPCLSESFKKMVMAHAKDIYRRGYLRGQKDNKAGVVNPLATKEE